MDRVLINSANKAEEAISNLEMHLKKTIPNYKHLTIYTGETGTYYTEIHLDGANGSVIGSNGFERTLGEALQSNVNRCLKGK
jgi:hypothetical protein